MPYRFDFTARKDRAFYRGDHRTISFESTEDGAAKDISGATWLGQVRAYPGGPVLLTLTITTLDAAAGTWRLDWDDSDGETLLAATAVRSESFWYDIQRTLGGIKTTLLHGELEVSPDISRA
jgi:hypothetical protein